MTGVRCPGGGIRRWWAAPSLAALLVLLAPAAAKKPPGENVHRPDVECRTCHTVDRAQLDADRKAAKSALAGDLEARCMLCHGDEGPSHHTGIRPQKPVPDTLPLSAEGLITCATCHFVHGEQNPFGKLVRLDNSRGGLCLACHELADLQ